MPSEDFTLESIGGGSCSIESLSHAGILSPKALIPLGRRRDRVPSRSRSMRRMLLTSLGTVVSSRRVVNRSATNDRIVLVERSTAGDQLSIREAVK